MTFTVEFEVMEIKWEYKLAADEYVHMGVTQVRVNFKLKRFYVYH